MPPLASHGRHGEKGGIEIPLALAEIVAGWPLAASLAAVTAGGLRAGRRRAALNEALHELRRPLQALALAQPAGADRGEAGVDGSLRMAAAALERLDREINGGSAPGAVGLAPLPPRPLLEAAVARWRGRASLAGGSLQLRWRADEALVSGDRCALAQALDNLVVNAIEHGGPHILVEVGSAGDVLRVGVRDSGRASRPPSRRETPAELIARLSGRRRHGHGLRVVRRTASAHGGSFALRRSDAGTTALLELPLLDAAEAV